MNAILVKHQEQITEQIISKGVLAQAQFLNEFATDDEFENFLGNRSIFIHTSQARDLGLTYEENSVASFREAFSRIEKEETTEDFSYQAFAYTSQAILALEESGLVTINHKNIHYSEDYISLSFKEGIVLSKASFKQIAKANAKSRVDLSKLSIHRTRLGVVAEVISKTLKYKQSYLKTVLANRLAGVYKQKWEAGYTWNKDGI